MNLYSNFPAYVREDTKRLYQVLINLSNNALKFTKFRKVVLQVACVKTMEKEALIRFEITETGIGMREEILSHSFKGFEPESSTIQKNMTDRAWG